MKINMADIIWRLGLPAPERNSDSYYVRCPVCDEGKRKHLNINFQKNVFRCAKCGESGGVYDLYALFTGLSKEKTHEVLSYDNHNMHIEREQAKEQMEAVTVSELSDIDSRHRTYCALLEKLTLCDKHFSNLLNRGLDEYAVYICGYKSAPVKNTQYIAQQLFEEGYKLEGVPGFYKNKNGRWDFFASGEGILIPVRDINNKIQGLQIRLDNAEKGKYRWISSGDKNFGCRAKTWCHLSGDEYKEIILTEGPLKGAKCSAISV